MARTRTMEYIFFFGILGATVYVMWQIVAPFFGALAVAGIIVTVSYPFYKRVLSHTPGHNKSLASALTTLLIGLLVVIPLSVLGYLIFTQALSLYGSLNQHDSLLAGQAITHVEALVQRVAPSFTLEVSTYARQAAGWFVTNVGVIFAETASTIFLVFVAIVAVFYFFRDGGQCVRYLISLSPLPDTEDRHIIKRLVQSVRSVVLGTLAVALIQGLLTAAGFALFGIGQPVLWGAVAGVGSLIPGVGTLIVFLPAIAFLILEGAYGTAMGLAIWGTLAVGMIDNVLGPYLMSRGVPLHPFLVLLTVLGGIAVFGPMGFILGPVTLSLLTVLLELHGAHQHSDWSEKTSI